MVEPSAATEEATGRQSNRRRERGNKKNSPYPSVVCSPPLCPRPAVRRSLVSPSPAAVRPTSPVSFLLTCIAVVRGAGGQRVIRAIEGGRGHTKNLRYSSVARSRTMVRRSLVPPPLLAHSFPPPRPHPRSSHLPLSRSVVRRALFTPCEWRPRRSSDRGRACQACRHGGRWSSRRRRRKSWPGGGSGRDFRRGGRGADRARHRGGRRSIRWTEKYRRWCCRLSSGGGWSEGLIAAARAGT